jgi:glutamyl-tRNA synthetase
MRGYVEKAVELVRERATFTADLWDSAQCLFVAPTEYSQKDVEKFWKAEHYEYCFEVCQYITGVNFGFDDLVPWQGPMMQEALETAIVDYIKMREYPMGKVMNSLRLALTGAASGLGIAAILSFIGRREFARRMTAVAENLGRI